MSQINVQVTPSFKRALAALMKARGFKTKSEAIRVAVGEALAAARPVPVAGAFEDWIGLGNRAPRNPTPRFPTDRSLWE